MPLPLICQRGMALLVSLVFMLLLSLIGMAAMVSATLQEKMSAGVQHANHSFQAAEAALGSGEAWLQIKGAGYCLALRQQAVTRPQSACSGCARHRSGLRGTLGKRCERAVWRSEPWAKHYASPFASDHHYPFVSSYRYWLARAVAHGTGSIFARYQGPDNASQERVARGFHRVMWRQLQ